MGQYFGEYGWLASGFGVTELTIESVAVSDYLNVCSVSGSSELVNG